MQTEGTLTFRPLAAKAPLFPNRPLSEKGSIVFFLAFALPILFLALTLTLDLKRLYFERQIAQELADGAALVAARNLPFSKLAKDKAGLYVSRYQHTAPYVYDLSVDEIFGQ